MLLVECYFRVTARSTTAAHEGIHAKRPFAFNFARRRPSTTCVMDVVFVNLFLFLWGGDELEVFGLMKTSLLFGMAHFCTLQLKVVILKLADTFFSAEVLMYLRKRTLSKPLTM